MNVDLMYSRAEKFNKGKDYPVDPKELQKMEEIRALKASRQMTSDIAESKDVALTKEGLKSPAPSGGEVTTQGKLAAANQLASALGSQSGETSGTAAAGQGALSGALAGSSIAPGMGTAVGAVVGGTIGLLKARSARKQRAREAAAKAHQNIAAIHQQEAGNISSALENIRSGFQASLIRPQGGIRF